MPAMRKHPWDKWMARKRLKLKKGRDFICEPHGLAQQIRRHAADRDLKASITISDGVLDVILEERE